MEGRLKSNSIMDNKYSLTSVLCHDGYCGFHKQKGLPLSFRHVRKEDSIIFRKGFFHGYNQRNTITFSKANILHSSGLMRIVEADQDDMTGERSRKEPVG